VDNQSLGADKMQTTLLLETFSLSLPLVLTGIIAVIAGAIVTWGILQALGKSKLAEAETKSKILTDETKLKSENIIKTAELESKTKALKLQEETKKEFDDLRSQLHQQERDLSKKESRIDRQIDSNEEQSKKLQNKEQSLGQKEQNVNKKESELARLLEEQKSALLKQANMSEEQAKEVLLERLQDDVSHEASALIEKTVTKAKDEAEKKSRDLVLNALQRYAASQTCEGTVSTVDIPSDDMKGRVIGREGRNIRAFEKATGVDVIIDDTPGVVIISAFDPVRREIARLALAKLIQDGRIHPTRIEEVIEEITKEMDERVIDIGKKIALETNLPGLSPKILPYLGRMSYRTSYGQNVLRHSVEVAYLCQAMAEELGLDGELARRCGLLHDIGKAADHEEEGGHPAIGANIAKRCNERAPEVINAIAGHHGDIAATSPYTPLVAAADAMSASRPGARRETMERYIKRLEALEDIATSFPGTKRAYAIQAGREVRVIVDPEKVDDAGAWDVARDIAQKVQDELTYPGEVKITLLREVRCIEYAR
jgi:ribonuclease Y